MPRMAKGNSPSQQQQSVPFQRPRPIIHFLLVFDDYFEVLNIHPIYYMQANGGRGYVSARTSLCIWLQRGR